MTSRVFTSESPAIITTESDNQPALVLRATTGDALDGRDRRHVITWAPGTVDNEYMGKKKSKCCCVYEKPRNWDDPSSSSSSDSDENDDDPNPRRCTENCRGHTKHCYTKKAASKQKEIQSGSSTVVIEPEEQQHNITPPESHRHFKGQQS
ncbi:unnamed protein product [Hymenolepis diminuta]|uniref:E3 ubiquitin-protein ligase PPP1R11 n=1 Tax=Hymenolepis diminuta TaxID=6216 RepID=A0A0R3SM72_HYMDI|nr:unnamed protein product [Hymenolepis diminuta]VUZ43702.1 unnamed protein product [Hymenolepis diminuta]